MFRPLQIFLLLITLDCYSQSQVWGRYSICRETEIGELSLLPGGAYYFARRGGCGMPPVFRDSGSYTLRADTVFLQSFDRTRETRSFLAGKIYTPDTARHLPLTIYSLGELFMSQNKLTTNFPEKINQFQFLGTKYFKTDFYSEDGHIILRTNTFGKIQVQTYYFPNGQISAIESYCHGKKCNYWYTYSQDGHLLKARKYRRNKLVWTKTPAR